MRKIKYILLILALTVTLVFTSCVNDPIDTFYIDEGYINDIDSSNVTTILLVAGNITTDALLLTDTVWDDLRTPVNALRVPGTKAPSWTGNIGGQTLLFSDAALEANEQEVYFAVQLPHSYKEGTDIFMHVHYSLGANQVGTCVRWGLEYTWTNINGHIGGTTTIHALTAPSNNDAIYHFVTEFPAISGVGKTISSMLICRLFRNSSDVSDNYTNNVYLIEVDAHHEIDTIGSATVDAK